MLNRIIAIGIVLSCCANVLADYVSDRKAAVALVNAGKHEEALAAFTKMAEGEVSDVQKSDALDQAATCALRLKRYDQAMELARQIPLAPASKTVQMRILMEERKPEELISRFGDEQIDGWPEYLAAEAFHLRGLAYYRSGNGEKAAADLKRAAEYLTNGDALGLALVSLGDTYRDLLKDDAQAIDAYRKVYETYNICKHCAAAIAVAGILARQQKCGDALQELNKIDRTKLIHPYWKGAMLAALGDVLAKQGKKAEAIARYEEALQVDGLAPSQQKACQEALKRLQADVR